MGYETLKEERKIEILPDHKFKINLEQQDVYDAINIVNMVEAWKTKKDASTEFLSKIDELKENVISEAQIRIDNLVKSHEEKIIEVKRSIDLWTPSLQKWITANPIKYELILAEIKEAKNRNKK